MTDTFMTLFYAPNSRATTTRVILEELGVPCEMKTFKVGPGTAPSANLLKANPLGKVPALRHGDRIVTEAVAIALYAADLFPEAGLAPPVTDPLRADYLRWMVFYSATFEPAMLDRSLNHAPNPVQSTYRTYDDVVEVLANQLEKAPYMLGDRISIVDFQYASTIHLMMMFKLLPAKDVFKEYAARITSRPSFRRVLEEDARLAAELEVAA